MTGSQAEPATLICLRPSLVDNLPLLASLMLEKSHVRKTDQHGEYIFSHEDVLTARLRLITITPEMLNAEAASPQHLAPLLRVKIPVQWPDANWESHVFAFIKHQYVEHPHTLGWHRYVVLADDNPVLIGSVGAFPRSGESAEIGYAILGPWQSSGYATEAARALIQQIFADGARSVVAHTDPHRIKSIRVMEKCGLLYESPGEEAGSVRYGLTRPG